MPPIVYKNKDKRTIKRIQNYVLPLVTSRIVVCEARQLGENKY